MSDMRGNFKSTVIAAFKMLAVQIGQYTPGKKHVLLVAHNEIMFECLRPIYEMLVQDGRLDLRFYAIKEKWSDLNNLYQLKQSSKLNWVSDPFVQYLNWDLILFPNHPGLEYEDIYLSHSSYRVTDCEQVSDHIARSFNHFRGVTFDIWAQKLSDFSRYTTERYYSLNLSVPKDLSEVAV